ncbi:MAG: ribonuclease J [Candidatus Sumerlaeia bacterium]
MGSKKSSKNSIRLIPLGGVEEFGMNMMCYECGDERVIVDCGAMFPEADMLGVDLVIPDITWLLEEPEKVKAIVLTHGHDDHIGALPYILPELNVPVYGTPLTLAYVAHKLSEHGILEDVDLVEIPWREWTELSDAFEVMPVHVTHSMPDSAAIALRCAAGVVIQTGDYKIDYAPLTGQTFDFATFSRLGEEGILALVGDSTNADVSGSTQSEVWVARHLEPIFASSLRAIYCSTFSSSVHRIQLLMDLACAFGRKIFIAGRSLERTIAIASEQGFLKPPRKEMMSLKEIEKVPPHKRMIIATGSQAEALSAMSRISVGEHKQLHVEEDDTVIISSRVIPGHLRPITRMINRFYKLGARVYDSISHKVHASGHAYAEEIKAMISLTQPRYLVPVHGELRQIMHHRRVAMDMGFHEDAIHILEDGDVLELSNIRARYRDKIETGHVLVDGKTIGETGEVVLRDRQHLSEDGMIIAILNVDQKTGQLVTDPEIVTRGFVYVDESEEIIEDLKGIVGDAFRALTPESREDHDFMHAELRRSLRKHIKKTYQRFPMILPVVQEI